MAVNSRIKIQRVLFVCAGNTCRSPIAAAVARQLLGSEAQVESAGTAADDGAAATTEAVQVMTERGLNIDAHRSRSLRSVALTDFDVVVALTPSIAQTLRNQEVDASKLKSLDIPDPLGRGLETYRVTAVAIERDLRRLFGLEPEAPPKE